MLPKASEVYPHLFCCYKFRGRKKKPVNNQILAKYFGKFKTPLLNVSLYLLKNYKGHNNIMGLCYLDFLIKAFLS